MRVGAIDIGSNSIRLLVAEVERAADGSILGLETIARAGEPCRMARGLGRTGMIEKEVGERAATLAEEFARRARSLGAQHLVVGATAALRASENGEEVARRIEARCGAPVRILSGDEEARYVYRAVVTALGPSARRSPCVVFDLGGGSTEVVSGLGLEIGRWTSLPFGAVNLTEKHLNQDPPDPGELAMLDAAIEKEIMHRCALLPPSTPVLAGVGGTITLLAGLDRGLTTYEPKLLEGHRIPLERLAMWIERLRTSTHEARLAMPLMGEGRADIVVAGALVVGALARRFPTSDLVCSTQGLRYALAHLAAEELIVRSNETQSEQNR
jgi:exopolyphosphatase/guanosine-5'-triphosphate,3'-diphosphate pyrophosphatase